MAKLRRATMNESDIVLLINYLHGAPQQMRHVPGRGDPEPADEYRIIVTRQQRDALVDALRHYQPGVPNAT